MERGTKPSRREPGRAIRIRGRPGLGVHVAPILPGPAGARAVPTRPGQVGVLAVPTPPGRAGARVATVVEVELKRVLAPAHLEVKLELVQGPAEPRHELAQEPVELRQDRSLVRETMARRYLIAFA